MPQLSGIALSDGINQGLSVLFPLLVYLHVLCSQNLITQVTVTFGKKKMGCLILRPQDEHFLKMGYGSVALSFFQKGVCKIEMGLYVVRMLRQKKIVGGYRVLTTCVWISSSSYFPFV